MKKNFALFTIFFLCFATILPLPAYAGEKQEWTLVVKQGKAFFTVPFENDEPWKCVYKKTYNINSAKSSNKSVAVADIYKKHWLNIRGIKKGSATITVSCSGNYTTVINVRVLDGNIEKSTDYIPFAPNPYKYFDYVGQSKYNGIAKDEFRIKSKYAICKLKINGMQPGDILTARYGKYPVEYHNGGDEYITKTNAASRYSLEFINSYRPTSKSYKGKYFDQLCEALTRSPHGKTLFKARLRGYDNTPSYGNSEQIYTPYIDSYYPGGDCCGGNFGGDPGEELGYHSWLQGFINVSTYCDSKKTFRYTSSSPFYKFNSNGAGESYVTASDGGPVNDKKCDLRVQSGLMAFQYYSPVDSWTVDTNFLQLVEFSDCHTPVN